MATPRDPHEVLGVSAGASLDEIHRAFRHRLREHHPDLRHPLAAQDADSDQALQHILSAYASLRRRHALHSVVEDPRGPDALRRPEQQQPPLRATPVQWLPYRPPIPHEHRRAPDMGRPPTVESLIRWLLDR